MENSDLRIDAVGLAIILGIMITWFPEFFLMNAIVVYITLVTVCIGVAMMVESDDLVPFLLSHLKA